MLAAQPIASTPRDTVRHPAAALSPGAVPHPRQRDRRLPLLVAGGRRFAGGSVLGGCAPVSGLDPPEWAGPCGLKAGQGWRVGGVPDKARSAQPTGGDSGSPTDKMQRRGRGGRCFGHGVLLAHRTAQMTAPSKIARTETETAQTADPGPLPTSLC